MTLLKRILVFLLPTVLVGLVSIGILIDRYNASRKTDLLHLLSIIQASSDGKNIALFSGSQQDTENPEFNRLQSKYTRISNTRSSIRYIYLMRRSDDRIIFLLDSKSNSNPSDEPLAQPGEIYENATTHLLRIFDSGKNTVIGPESDRWGTFVSALGPIYDDRGQITAVLGVDVDFGDWYRSEISYIAPYLIVLLLLIVVEIVGVVFYHRHQLFLQTQVHLANIVETSHDAIVSLNLDGTVRSWNQGATEIFGYTAAEAIGKKGSDLVYLPQQKNTFDSIYSQVRLGQSVRNLEADRRTKDGHQVTVLISANPIYDGQSVVGISVVAKDITANSTSQKSLALRNQELEKLNRLMINREIKMAELKSEIKLLKSKQ